MIPPYTWRAWLRDGNTIMRGDSFGNLGVVLSPSRLPQDSLLSLTLMPEMPGWPAAEVVLKDGERLEYHSIREATISPGGAPDLTSGVYRCVVLGIVSPRDGTKTHMLLHPGFSVVVMTGDYEALESFKRWQYGVAKAHGLVDVAEMPKLVLGR